MRQKVLIQILESFLLNFRANRKALFLFYPSGAYQCLTSEFAKRRRNQRDIEHAMMEKKRNYIEDVRCPPFFFFEIVFGFTETSPFLAFLCLSLFPRR
jgi:hypothetical protein